MASAVTSNIWRGVRQSYTHPGEQLRRGHAPGPFTWPAEPEEANAEEQTSIPHGQRHGDSEQNISQSSSATREACLTSEMQFTTAAEWSWRAVCVSAQGTQRGPHEVVSGGAPAPWLNRPAVSFWCCSPALRWSPIKQEKEIKAWRFQKRKWNIHKHDYTKPRES